MVSSISYSVGRCKTFFKNKYLPILTSSRINRTFSIGVCHQAYLPKSIQLNSFIITPEMLRNFFIQMVYVLPFKSWYWNKRICGKAREFAQGMKGRSILFAAIRSGSSPSILPITVTFTWVWVLFLVVSVVKEKLTMTMRSYPFGIEAYIYRPWERDEDLLAYLNKPQHSTTLPMQSNVIKREGPVGIIVLLVQEGIICWRACARHNYFTDSLNLDMEDILYFSDWLIEVGLHTQSIRRSTISVPAENEYARRINESQLKFICAEHGLTSAAMISGNRVLDTKDSHMQQNKINIKRQHKLSPVLPFPQK